MAILCCVCGVQIEPNAVNMCTSCVASEVDIAEGIDLHSEVQQCSACLRFQSRGKGNYSSVAGAWLECPWESKELMALCLKHIHGLSKVKLIDANFIWTEPHSKRIKIKLILEREVLNHARVQKGCVVTFVIRSVQCPDCAKQYRDNQWKGLVQLRQKADHKRTFFRLEQLILQHMAHAQAIGITTVKDGMDFYFATKNAAERFVHFLSSRVPMRHKVATKLVSENVRQNTANVQTVHSVELSPICKDDLLILPRKTAQSCSNISPLALCARTTAMMHLIDPRTGRKGELTSDRFWKLPFLPLTSSQNMIEFIVLDVEPVYGQHASAPAHRIQGTDRHMVLADIEVARASDFGANDTTFVVRSHLGGILEAGDTVKGYDLATANFGVSHTWSYKDDFPDIVLVRKIFPRDNKAKKSTDKLKKLSARRAEKLSKSEAVREEKEFEEFAEEYLDEVEAMDGMDSEDAAEDFQALHLGDDVEGDDEAVDAITGGQEVGTEGRAC